MTNIYSGPGLYACSEAALRVRTETPKAKAKAPAPKPQKSQEVLSKNDPNNKTCGTLQRFAMRFNAGPKL